MALSAVAARPALAETPPPLSIHYIGDLIADVAGGRKTGVSWISRLDVAYSSSDQLFGIEGAHAQADVMLLHGGGFSADRSGDYQVASNIDAPHAIRPYEAWVEIPFDSARFRAKAGLIDLNNEFDQQSVGTLFVNSSFGIGPDLSQSGPNGPSIFPVTAPGMVIVYQPPGHVTRIGIFDARAGDPNDLHRFFPNSFARDGALVIGESRWLIGSRFALQAGGWGYSDPQPRLDGPGSGTSAGGYATLEAIISGKPDGRSLRAWIRLRPF